MAAQIASSVDYLLHLADNALILGQRNAEWCGHGPVLEEDIAMANIGLDHIGQARLLYQHVAAQIGGEATEDRLAYFRNPEEFRNYVLLELPHATAIAPSAAVERNYAVTIARNFLYSSLMILLWEALQASKDAQLAAIAAKSLKEVRYHLRHSTDWMLRLGDGTADSHARMQAALDHLMPYTQEFWVPSTMEAEAAQSGLGVDPRGLQGAWQASVDLVLAEATLQTPSTKGHVTRGKEGQHSEHLSYLLAEMQSLARAHPQAVW
jgi:ring-1,2-phenylacetyl-CoA epoxidase subunit PaaC